MKSKHTEFDLIPFRFFQAFFAFVMINLWHHQGFITSYAHGNSNAATATIHGNTYPKAKLGIWKKVSLLVNEGQRTGNDIPQQQPNFENGAREHDFPDGVFAFQASTRRGQNAHWCECNGPTCDSRNRTSPPTCPRPFNVSAINPATGYRLRQAIARAGTSPKDKVTLVERPARKGKKAKNLQAYRSLLDSP
eukprot:g12663.t1